MDRNLIDYLPEIMRQYEEIQKLMDAEQKEMENLWKEAEKLILEGFVSSEGKTGAGRWEGILEIFTKDTDSLEVRNFRILGRLQENLPYSYRFLERTLQIMCGGEGFSMTLLNDACTLKIRLSLERKPLLEEVERLADRIVPANLLLDIQLDYNTYDRLAVLTHDGLAVYSHKGIQTELLRAAE